MIFNARYGYFSSSHLSMQLKEIIMLSPALKPAPARLSVTVGGIENNRPIAAKFAYCRPDGNGKSMQSDNINPEIRWSGAPEGTKSFALIVVDKDVPKTFELAGKEGKTIPKDFPRQNFYHWVLADIPASRNKISEGEDSKGVTQGGKPTGKTAYGVNGQNDYAAKAGMGLGGGYDGCCPPWNDERLHHYHFIVTALDVPTLGLSGNFTGGQAEAAMQGHVLAQGEVVGTYTNNPKLLPK